MATLHVKLRVRLIYCSKDRATYNRLERLSTESTRSRPGVPDVQAEENTCLVLTIDGMDQAKFRVPRNIQMTKETDKLWRPQEHLVGVLAAGVGEFYFLLSADSAKDSNMVQTLLSHSLDLVAETLRQRGRAMPKHLTLQMDNTTRENRNQHLNKWAAALVMRSVFRSVTFSFLPVGHTHINLDQRFSSIATGLTQQSILETPEDHRGQKEEKLTHTLTHLPNIKLLC
jgi:hypothetical protein